MKNLTHTSIILVLVFYASIYVAYGQSSSSGPSYINVPSSSSDFLGWATGSLGTVSELRIENQESMPINFYIDNSTYSNPHAYIDPNGLFGIGLGATITPAARLDVLQSIGSNINFGTTAGLFHNADAATSTTSSFDRIGINGIVDGTYNYTGVDPARNIGGLFHSMNCNTGNIGLWAIAGGSGATTLGAANVGGFFEAIDAADGNGSANGVQGQVEGNVPFFSTGGAFGVYSNTNYAVGVDALLYGTFGTFAKGARTWMQGLVTGTATGLESFWDGIQVDGIARGLHVNISDQGDYGSDVYGADIEMHGDVTGNATGMRANVEGSLLSNATGADITTGSADGTNNGIIINTGASQNDAVTGADITTGSAHGTNNGIIINTGVSQNDAVFGAQITTDEAKGVNHGIIVNVGESNADNVLGASITTAEAEKANYGIIVNTGESITDNVFGAQITTAQAQGQNHGIIVNVGESNTSDVVGAQITTAEADAANHGVVISVGDAGNRAVGSTILMSGDAVGNIVGDSIYISGTTTADAIGSSVRVSPGVVVNVPHFVFGQDIKSINHGGATGITFGTRSVAAAGHAGIATSFGVFGLGIGGAPQGGAFLEGGQNIGVVGYAQGNAVYNFGVMGISRGSGNIHVGVYGEGSSNAGLFNGNVFGTGTGVFVLSDSTVKDSIQTISNSLSTIMQLTPKSYIFNREGFPGIKMPEGRHNGLIAQEVETILPNLIDSFYLPPPMDSLGNIDTTAIRMGFKALNYTELIPVLVAGEKELKQSVDSLRGGALTWVPSGNLGTNPDSNYIGTKDSVGLSIRAFNVKAINITPDGKVGINTTTPGNTLEINSSASSSTPGASGLRFTDLKSTSTAGTSIGKVLTVDANGDVILVKDSIGSGGGGGSGDVTACSTRALNYFTKWTNTSTKEICNTIMYDDGTNVGVSTTSPAFKLDVNGDINLPNRPSAYNIGGVPWMWAAGTACTYVGEDAGAAARTCGCTPASGNTFIGKEAGKLTLPSSNGYGNTFVGAFAGASNVHGYINVFNGNGAGTANTSGYDNVMMGVNAGEVSDEGFENVYIGGQAGHNSTTSTASNNVMVGKRAGNANETGDHITCLGDRADVVANNLSYASSIGAGATINSSNAMSIGRTADRVLMGYNSVPSDTTGGSRLYVDKLSGGTRAAYFNGTIYCTGIYSSSDAQLKKNITDIHDADAILDRLAPKSYTFDQQNNSSLGLPSGIHYGMLAQDVEAVLPSAVETEKSAFSTDTSGNIIAPSAEIKAVNYQEFIPLLIASNKQLRNRVDQLEALINSCCSRNQRKADQGGDDTGAKFTLPVELHNAILLEQNSPNPFAEHTTINFNLTPDIQNAQIIFYDNLGRILKSVPISERGPGMLDVYAGNLSSGIYTYSLLADGKVIDTKKMVCNK